MKQRLFSLFLIALMCLNGLDVQALAPNDKGVYEIGTAEDLVAFATLVNGGTTNANAVLTADIDMTGYGEKYPMIGNSGNPYAGVFDGQFHTISHLVLEREQGDVALVSYAQPGCTIKNLTLDATCSASGASHTAGFVSRCTGAHQPIYLLNLGYEGTIIDLGINAGGIHANSPSAGPITVMKNCYSTGKINGTDYNGQLSGWVGKDAIVENCWSTSEVTGTRSDEFFRRASATQTNCYSKYSTQATLITDEQVASGELTYLLNGDQTAINFYQTLGEDSHPVLSPAHGVVYPDSRLHCDGTPYESTGAYSNKKAAQDEHDFQKGVCTYCGKIVADYKKANADGYYELSEGGDLVWFAALVNAGTTNANALLTADIDMTDESASFPMIGNSGNPYAGVFDGQFHTISHLVLESEQGDVALVSYAQPGCTIKNLVLDETCSASGASHTAGFVSRCTGAHEPIYLLNLGYEGTITDLGINAGGIHANSPSAGPITVMKNCYSTGKINGTDYNGQLSGWVGKDAIVENCWSTAEVTGTRSEDLYRVNTATQTNCYSKYSTQATLITDEQVASGELCFLLNGDQTSINFYQTIGEDSHPVLSPSHGVVYPESRIHCDGTPYVSTGAYSNKEVAQDEHDFQNGICKYCGKIDADYKMANADGYYELSEGGDLVWFASMVNAGNKSFNAILTADIDMSGYSEKYPMIGNSSNPYAGVFDGQFHTISNLTLAREQGDVALVSYAQPGCTIKNLVLDETCSASGASHTAGIVSRCTGAHEPIYLLNLGYEGIITDLGINAGGIHANSPYAGPITVMKNCYSTGKINGTAYNGQLSGWVGRDAIIEDCWSTAEVTGVESDDFYMYRRSSATHKNCYSKYGTQVTPITDEQVASGELCWMLNHSMLNYEPVWYQTLGEDEYPVFDASHEIVYRAYDIFGSVNRTSIASERTNISDELVAFTEYNEVMATQSLIDAYTAEARALAEAADWNDLVERYARVDSLMQLVIASMDAYSAYQAKVDETKTFLAENPGIIGEYRDRVEDYLNEYSEVGERHPNGSYLYIIENHTLTTEEITAETEYLDLLLGQAIAGGYIKDSDVTSLLVNADFSKGFDGWRGTPGTEYGTAQNGAEGAALCKNKAMDMYQTLTGLKNGVYELQVSGLFHPAPESDLTSTNYAATLYANKEQNYFQTGIEDLVSPSEAQNGVNCLLSGNEADYTLNDGEETLGYMPRSLAGCDIAFQAGRYPNSILAHVTDGKLTVGVKLSGTGETVDGSKKTVTAHTGAYGTKYNSLDYVRAALEKKPDYLEIDIRFRPDGTLACSHDAITSNSQGENLREVFNLVRGSSVKIMLDIKETATLKALYTLLTEYGLEKQVVLAGLNEQGVVTARENCPGIPYLLNYSPDTQKINDADYQKVLLDLLKTTGCIGINCNYKYATQTLADVLHADGFLLSVWTVNEETDMMRMLKLGADNIGTMEPDLLYSVMKKAGIVADWLGFGNIKLTYRGELEEATQALDAVLASQAARANTILNAYTFSFTLDYANYPNFSQDIKDQLQQAIDAIATTEDAAGKYALIGTFSKLFQQVYDCKRAYISLMTQSIRLTDIIPEFGKVMSEEETAELVSLVDKLSGGYIDGSFSIDEASKDYLSELALWPTRESGAYQIGTGRDLAVFAIIVNSGETDANAVLTADIDMTGYSEKYPMIGNSSNPYAGIFDGQFHTISNLTLAREQGDVALVSYAQPGCTIKNLVLDETCSASGASHTAGIVSRCTGAHEPIYLLNLGYEGTITDLGINAGGIHANSPSAGPITVMKNCYSTGKINGTDYNGQLSGWVGKDAIVENCWSTAEVTGTRSEDLYRVNTATQTNCYSKYSTQATLITDQQVASGELCFLLNGDQTEINWYQTLGEDRHPTLFPSHGIVMKNEDGGYGNLDGVNLPSASSRGRGVTSASGVYDLSGRRIAPDRTKGLTRGLYIIDGEKVVVR